jgi:hypothetical protein
MTYVLGSSRKTILKASYSRYAEALGAAAVSVPNNSLGVAYAYYAWNDANRNDLVEPAEVDRSAAGLQFARNLRSAAARKRWTPIQLR